MADKPMYREGDEVWLARLDLPEKTTVYEDPGGCDVWLESANGFFSEMLCDRKHIHRRELAALLASRDMLAERLERVNSRIEEIGKEKSNG